MKHHKGFKAVFFDLDHTLWDFETNSREAIGELLVKYRLLGNHVPDLKAFMDAYTQVNKLLWDRYHESKISKDYLRVGRFADCLSLFGLDDRELAVSFSEDYLLICPDKNALFPDALDVLDRLRGDHSLHIITNGFREVQYRKLSNSGLIAFFDHIHISEEIGWQKPEREIFEYALKMAKAQPEECVMVGDNPDTDIKGALNCGIQPVLFDPQQIIHGADPRVWKAATLCEVESLITQKKGS